MKLGSWADPWPSPPRPARHLVWYQSTTVGVRFQYPIETQQLRARRPERQEQVDQVQHVRHAVAVDILAGVARRGRRQAEAEQKVDQVQHVGRAIPVDVGRGVQQTVTTVQTEAARAKLAETEEEPGAE